MMTSTRKSVVVRASTLDDRPAIAALLDSVLSPVPFRHRVSLWDWRHSANPAGSPTLPEFLVAELDGELVGAHGLLPLRLKAGSIVTPSVYACDFAVRADSRGVGLRLKLAANSASVGPLHLSSSANTAANKLTLATGGHEVLLAQERSVMMLASRPFLERQLETRVPAPLAKVGARLASAPIDLGLAVNRRLRRLGRGLPSGMHLSSLQTLDDRADLLWERVSEGSKIQIVRDASYLDWRYLRYPFPGIRLDGLFASSTLIGIVATHVTIDERGEPGLAILDIFADHHYEGASAALLDCAIRRAECERATDVTLLGARQHSMVLSRALVARTFTVRRAGVSPYTYRVADKSLSSLLENQSDWRVSLGDGDAWFRTP